MTQQHKDFDSLVERADRILDGTACNSGFASVLDGLFGDTKRG